jgi:beta-glucosidase/6-phospho-beta-glucosidase/beta-galactosidase
VRGAAVDNYEWSHGFDVPFGLIDRNQDVRDSAKVIAAAATAS